jgi:hypothetical protein
MLYLFDTIVLLPASLGLGIALALLGNDTDAYGWGTWFLFNVMSFVAGAAATRAFLAPLHGALGDLEGTLCLEASLLRPGDFIKVVKRTKYSGELQPRYGEVVVTRDDKVQFKSWPSSRHRWFWADVPERFVCEAKHDKWFSVDKCYRDNGPLPATALTALMVLFVANQVLWLTGWEETLA